MGHANAPSAPSSILPGHKLAQDVQRIAFVTVGNTSSFVATGIVLQGCENWPVTLREEVSERGSERTF